MNTHHTHTIANGSSAHSNSELVEQRTRWRQMLPYAAEAGTSSSSSQPAGQTPQPHIMHISTTHTHAHSRIFLAFYYYYFVFIHSVRAAAAVDNG